MKSFKEILLVEDEPLFQSIIQTFIKKNELAERVVCKSNGAEALAFLKDTSWSGNELIMDRCPDLILLDLSMPVMNGFEFLQALRELGAEILIHSKVVVLSAYTDVSYVKAVKSYGVKGCIQKPITIKKLQAIFS